MIKFVNSLYLLIYSYFCLKIKAHLGRKSKIWCCHTVKNEFRFIFIWYTFLQPDSNHPRDVLPFLCRRFYYMGWMSGTGGALSIKQGYVQSLVTSLCKKN